MRILFDQNISFRIISKISDTFPEARQVRELGIENYPDEKIWSFAKENNYTIVTFDSDFFDISNLKGHPPKSSGYALETQQLIFFRNYESKIWYN